MSEDSDNAGSPEAGQGQESPNPARFEEALAELEQLVESLEGGDLGLEDALSHFERGVSLARECRESLSAAEQKVQALMEREGGETLGPFDPEEDSDGQ